MGVRILLFNFLNPKHEGPTTTRGFCGNRQKLSQNRFYKHSLRKCLRGAKNWLQMTFQLFPKKCSECDVISKKLSGGVRILLFNSLNPKNQGPTTTRGFCGNRQKLPQTRFYKHSLRKSLRGAKNWLQMTFQLFL